MIRTSAEKDTWRDQWGGPTPTTSSAFRGQPSIMVQRDGNYLTWAFLLILIARFTSVKQLNSCLKAIVLALTEFVWN